MLVVWCDLCLLCGGACACCVLGFVLCMVGPVFVVWRGLCLLTVWWGLCLLCGGRLCLLCGRGRGNHFPRSRKTDGIHGISIMKRNHVYYAVF